MKKKCFLILLSFFVLVGIVLVCKTASDRDDAANVDVNYAPLVSAERLQYGLTMFQQAIAESNVEQVKWCLEHGADVESRIKSAYYLGNPRIKTACLNVEGYTPLHLAVYVGNAEVVRLLLAHSPNLESRITPYGYTPLLSAVALGDEKILSLLIQSGADVHAVTGGGKCWEERDKERNALDIATQYQHTECIRILSQYLDPSSGK